MALRLREGDRLPAMHVALCLGLAFERLEVTENAAVFVADGVEHLLKPQALLRLYLSHPDDGEGALDSETPRHLAVLNENEDHWYSLVLLLVGVIYCH